ncbi:hypothetical protein [Hymenobacter metallilatus]|uniref:Uncharacterized protein n=1 Tax=Hymenobacter metallilatus TaxID=2493666 RepID=A0A428JSK1_9BACT|nr:hypothetical protein [Hymenobacter metallilatus]RSK37133.1 hypothetical protein EI290_00245 [Hymenobacter metallilatus]
MTDLYYQPSGRFTVGGILGLLLVGALAAVPLAFLYVYAVWYIPFIYINFFMTLMFGFLLGWVLKKMVRTGKIRNPRLAGWLSVAVGVWAWYVQWCVYMALLAGAGETESLGSRASFAHTTFQEDVFLGMIIDPGTLFGVLPELAENGTWSIFSATPSGIFLYLIWLAEFLIIVVLTWMQPHSEAGVPFSELAQEWAEKTTLPQRAIHFPDAAAAKAALEAADWHQLQPHAQEEITVTSPSSRLHFYRAPSDPQCCYLSLENITVEVDNKGKSSEKTADVVEYLRVPPHICTELHTRFSTDAVASASVPEDPAAYSGTYQ